MSIKGLACTSLLLIAAGLTKEEFKGFHAVEAYEVRPGILMVPTYSSQGEVCRVVLEKRHYSGNVIDLDTEMSHEQIDDIFDQLVPSKDRGPKPLGKGVGEFSITDGGPLTVVEYENVSLAMAGREAKTGKQDYAVAIIRWKRRACN